MNRTDRLIAIVLLLHSRKIIRAKDIAEHFDITLRTVYRDMKALNEAGVPIAAEAGEGYSLVEGYHLPPVMFTHEEAAALLVGSELTRSLTDASLQTHITSALHKIQAVLPQDRKNYLDNLRDALHIVTYPSRFKEGFRDDVLKTIQDAIVHRRILTIEYITNRDDRQSKRNVEPLGLVYYSNFWHLIAYCRLRKDYRDFRTDRITAIQVKDESFASRDDFSLTQYLSQSRPVENLIQVRVKFTYEVVSYVRDRNYFGIVSEEKTEGGVIFTFLTPELKYLSGWLLGYGEHAEILEPKALKQIMYDEAVKLTQMYKP
ncbi:YafY family transcriptional regulator [bacterium]|nr:YafY family transcriptional regulator [bacterium]NUN46457.1 YafY family transcriptional regulator [bacterium]